MYAAHDVQPTAAPNPNLRGGAALHLHPATWAKSVTKSLAELEAAFVAEAVLRRSGGDALHLHVHPTTTPMF